MKSARREGIQGATFGAMEGTIMMLGVMLGLSVTGDRLIVALGLLTAGIADAFANSASFFVSEESEKMHSRKEIFKATMLCFVYTILAVAMIAAPIIMISSMKYAMISSIGVGLLILVFLGRFMSAELGTDHAFATIAKYVAIGIITAFVCYLTGSAVEHFSAYI